MQLTTDVVVLAQTPPSAWASAWEWAKEYVKPAAVLIPLASAYFGAKTAQGTADRNKFRDELTKEIRNTNASISLAFAVANSAMALQRQHIRDLKADFDRGRSDLIEFKRRLAAREPQANNRFEPEVRLNTLQVPKFPSSALRSHVLDRLSVTGRALHLAITLDENVEHLQDVMERRNSLVPTFAKTEGVNDEEIVHRYYGVDTGKSATDTSYADLIDGMASTLDAVIFFAAALSSDLHDHGNALAAKFRKRLRWEDAPRVHSVNFATQKASGLMPGHENYDSIMKAFVKLPPVPPSRWRRALQIVRLRRADDPTSSGMDVPPEGQKL